MPYYLVSGLLFYNGEMKMKIAGQELLITPSSFDDAQELQRAVGYAISENNINFDGSKIGESLESSEIGAGTIGDIIKVIISLGISKDLERALFKCAERALIGDDRKKINRDFFEPVENREFYYPVMIEILKVNLTPFFKGLFSSSGGLMEKITGILK